MSTNRGTTSLRRRRRAGSPMREYDRLPPELRGWLSGAILPWRAGSVQRAFDKAMARTGDTAQALQELDRLQSVSVARDARVVWGQDHPAAAVSTA